MINFKFLLEALIDAKQEFRRSYKEKLYVQSIAKHLGGYNFNILSEDQDKFSSFSSPELTKQRKAMAEIRKNAVEHYNAVVLYSPERVVAAYADIKLELDKKS